MGRSSIFAKIYNVLTIPINAQKMKEIRSQEKFLIPKGWEKITGACGGNKWVLCWKNEKTAAWSNDNDWIKLPSAPSEISKAFPASKGIMVVCEDAESLGFWKYGNNDWQWWRKIPNLKTNILNLQILSEIIIFFEQSYKNILHFYSYSENTFTQIKSITINENVGFFVSAWADNENKDIQCLFSKGFYKIIDFQHKSELLRIKKFDIGDNISYFDRHVVKVNDTVFFSAPRSSMLALNLASGIIKKTGLGHLPFCEEIWDFYSSNERTPIKQILKFLLKVPQQDSLIDWTFYDLVFDSGRPIAVATSLGIFYSNKISKGRPWYEKLFKIWSFPFRLGLITWLIWIDKDKYLPPVLELILEIGIDEEELIDSIHTFYGMDFCRLLMEHVRGKSLKTILIERPIQKLFGSFSYATKPRIKKSIQDKDPFVKYIGWIACGAVDEDSGNSLVWENIYDFPLEIVKDDLKKSGTDTKKVIMDACKSLKLEGVSLHIKPFLIDENSELREKAVDTLAALPHISSSIKIKIEEMALTDPEEDVREASAKALRYLFRGRETIEVLLKALTDMEFSVRADSEDVLTEHWEIISKDQLVRLTEIISLLFISQSLTDDDSDFILGIESLLSNITEKYFESYVSSSGKIAALDVNKSESFFYSFLCSLFISLIFFGEEIIDFDELNGIIPEMIRLTENEHLLSEEDFEFIKTDPTNSLGLIKLTIKLINVNEQLGNLLALLIYFHLDEKLIDGQSLEEKEESFTSYIPLHKRLRSLSDNIFDKFTSLIKNLTQNEDDLGNLALFVLAAKKDKTAKEQLGGRILAGKTKNWPVFVRSYSLLLTKNQQTKFLSKYIESPEVPFLHRYFLLKAWEDEEGKLLTESKRVLFYDFIDSDELFFDDKLNAARELADFGETNYLENMWISLEKQGKIDESDFYYFSRDMARCGHKEYMKNVRKKWIKVGDLEALKAFDVCGTVKDIPELKRALELKAPEDLINNTIKKIKARNKNYK